MLRTIRLYGELGKKYGKVHKLHVASVSEAIRALCANFKDFRQHLTDSGKRIAGYEVWDGKYNLSEEDKETFHLNGNADIKIIPRVKGGSNAFKIIAGVVLIAIGYVLTFTPFAPAAPYFYSMGVSMILGGVVGMMTKNNSGLTNDSATENTESYIFSGPVNSTKQGNPVRVGYGKMIVGSQVISAALTTTDLAI